MVLKRNRSYRLIKSTKQKYNKKISNIPCDFCKKKFKRYQSHITQNIKNNNNNYCCKECQSKGQHNKLTDNLSMFRYMLAHIKCRCKRENIYFDISLYDLKKLWEKCYGKCSLTGELLKFGLTRKEMKSGGTTASIDRKDSSKGYTIDNIWFVHKRINKIKQDLPIDEFICWCQKVTAFANGTEPSLTEDDPAV